MKKRLSALLLNHQAEYYLTALGIFVTVLYFWIPFGWKTTDVNDGWRNFYLMSTASWFDVLTKPFQARYLIFLPWKLGYTLNPGSFLGVRLVMMLTFWAKSYFLYLILRKLRLVPPYLAFLISILFMLYPADQGIFLMAALGRHFAVMLYLVSVYFMIMASQGTLKTLSMVLMIVTAFVTGVMSEQGFPVMFITPAILWLDANIPPKARRDVIVGWYATLMVCVAVFASSILFPGETISGGVFSSQYQSQILKGTKPTLSFDFLLDIVKINLSAYQLFFIGGWQIALQNMLTVSKTHLAITLAAASMVSLTAYGLSRIEPAESSEQYLPRHFGAVVISSILILVLTYLPYSVTIHSDKDFRIFYYAAISGALMTAYLFNLLIRRFPGRSVQANLVFFGLLTVVITINGLDQQFRLTRRSEIQQRVMLDIVAQAPYILPETQVILLTDDLNKTFVETAGFTDDRPFRLINSLPMGLQWMYNDPTLTGTQCSAANCFANKPTNKLLVFQYTRDHHAILLSEIPAKFVVKDKKGYQPYTQITSYTPFPESHYRRYQLQPDPTLVAPFGWTGTKQTMNDRKICNASHRGDCSLLFSNSKPAASFTQTILAAGKPGDEVALTFWVKGTSKDEGPSRLAVLTIIYQDETQNKVNISRQVPGEWSQRSLKFQVEKAVSGFILSFEPETSNGPVWIDDVQLIINGVLLPIANPSFEE
ncbi:MAG: hypothetical protein ACOYY3_03865 [Chloroflexota bacterium]